MKLIKNWWNRISVGLRPHPRSNGVRVRRTTAVHIKAGNMARGVQDWICAANAYRQALACEPHLQHLWVQLGHMEKEAGAIDRAAAAYTEAARLRPDDAEPLLQLGHMAKSWHQPIEATRYFVAALQRNRAGSQAISELVRLMPDRNEVDSDLWNAILSVLEIKPEELQSDTTAQLPSGAMVFDVTDLLAFFGQRRLPTGIQRVQIEVSLACLETNYHPQPVFCVYASARRGWIRLPHNCFEELCRLARQSDDIKDPAWVQKLDQLHCRIAVARTIQFSASTVLINLGTSWSDRNYLLDVRTIRSRDGVVYVPLVFDLIPLIGPHWFMQSLVRDYKAWFGSLLHSADGCLAISEATREDLLSQSARWNAAIPRDLVPVVRLDGNFRRTSSDANVLVTYGLEVQDYVLFVSTIEPRKNHQGAFEAWLALVDLLGEASVPRLVCVGGRGWLNEHLHQMLRERPALRRLVLILHGIPDDTLAALYEHCLFALYPSFYEGWGLPVSEALSYGKVPAISDVSSLPEAGGVYARYFNPNDSNDIAATVRALLNKEGRQEAEAAIHRDYAPRTWHQIAQDVVAKANMITSRVEDTLPVLRHAGIWSLALSHQVEDIQPVLQGEALRHGRSWLSPGIAGCSISGKDATLWFRWAGSRTAVLQIYIALAKGSITIRTGIDPELREHQAEAATTLIVSIPLPKTAATLRIPIIPLEGEIIVERIVIKDT